MLITQKLDVIEKTGCRFGFSTPKLPQNRSERISYKNFVEQCNRKVCYILETKKMKTGKDSKLKLYLKKKIKKIGTDSK